jgi:hypothetical protein
MYKPIGAAPLRHCFIGMYDMMCIVCAIQYIGFCILCHLHCTRGNNVEVANGNRSTMTQALQFPLSIMVVIPPEALTLQCLSLHYHVMYIIMSE